MAKKKTFFNGIGVNLIFLKKWQVHTQTSFSDKTDLCKLKTIPGFMPPAIALKVPEID